MADVLNVQLGVCTINFAGVDLGHTIGGVELTYSPQYHETKVDKYTGMVERFLIGEKFGAKVPLAESTLAAIKVAIPNATLSGSKLQIGSYAAKRLSSKAGLLVLHPIANAAGDRSADAVIYKAAVTNEIKIAYKNDGEKIYEALFEGFVDESKTDGNMLGLIGDSTT